MAYSIRNAADAEIDHRQGSMSLSLAVNRRGTMTFRMVNATYGSVALPFALGEDVYVKDGSAALVWGGTVESIAETDITEGSLTYRAATYQCTDFDQLARRKIVAAVYEGDTLATIAADLVTNYLAAEGVTPGTIETGPVITKAVFNYRTVADALDELAQLTGFSWWIDHSRALHFRSRAAIVSPWAITAGNKPYRGLSIKRSRYQYRNAQYVRAGTDLAASAAEVLVGDGTRRTFNVSLPVGAVPTIEVNTGSGYVAKTVGANGVASGVQYYYNIGRTEITQSTSETVLASTHLLRVTYEGQLPIIVRSDDAAEQATRAAAEGFGSGIYEAIDDQPEIDDGDLALDHAAALLRRYGSPPVTITFETDTAGLDAGQLLTITLADHGIDDTFLIESISIRARENSDLVYTVSAISTDAYGGWQEYFRRLQASTKTFVIRENEVLLILKNVPDSFAVADDPTVTAYTGAYEVDGVDTYIEGFHVG
jgi:hypothetical protein